MTAPIYETRSIFRFLTEAKAAGEFSGNVINSIHASTHYFCILEVQLHSICKVPDSFHLSLYFFIQMQFLHDMFNA